jgi:hypothetical protein
LAISENGLPHLCSQGQHDGDAAPLCQSHNPLTDLANSPAAVKGFDKHVVKNDHQDHRVSRATNQLQIQNIELKSL